MDRRRSLALWAAGSYALVGSLWVLCSHWLLQALVGEQSEAIWLQMLSSGLFVVTTAVVLFWMHLSVLTGKAAREAPWTRRNQEADLRTVLHSMDDVVIRIGPEGTLKALYGYQLERVGLQPERYLGKTLQQILGGKEAAVHEQAVQRAFAGESLVYEWEVPDRPGPVHVQIALSPVRCPEGDITEVVGVARNVTALRQDLFDLLESNRTLRAILHSSPTPMVAVDQQDRVSMWNPAAERLFGWRSDEVIGRPYSLLVPEEEMEHHRQLFERAAQGDCISGEEARRRTRDGQMVDLSVSTAPLRNAEGVVVGTVVVVEDITERKQMQEQIHHLALHDALTDLPNRRALEDRLNRAVTEASPGRPGALLMMDLDNFKMVNDTMGHPAGDRLLITLGKRFRSTLRTGDLVARLGGDEFAVLLEATSLETAREVAERLRRSVAEVPFVCNGQSVVLGLSIGIAPVDGRLSPSAVLSQADSALYAAKEAGKNRVFTAIG